MYDFLFEGSPDEQVNKIGNFVDGQDVALKEAQKRFFHAVREDSGRAEHALADVKSIEGALEALEKDPRTQKLKAFLIERDKRKVMDEVLSHMEKTLRSRL